MTSCLEEAQPTPDGNPSVCSGLVETADSPVLDGKPTAVESEQGSKTDKPVIVEQPVVVEKPVVETAESPVLDGRPAAVESGQESKTEQPVIVEQLVVVKQLVVVEKPKESSDPARDKDGDQEAPQPSQAGNPKVLTITDPKIGKGGSLTRNTLRQLRLDGVYLLFKELRGRIREMDHIPIYKNRWAASISTITHLLGVGAIAVLSSFILPEFYIGPELQGISGQDSEKLLALVLSAKVIELLAVFSLSTIVFTMVRHELVLGQGVPLAALGVGLQISDPTFLISKELLAIIKGKFSANWKKYIFTLLIIVFTILAVCIAPASATAMMPQKSSWRAGGTILWWNATDPTLFPDTLNETHTLGSVCNVTGSPGCPSYQWEVIAEQLISKLQGSAQVVNGQIEGLPPPSSLIVQGRDTRLELSISIREQPYDSFVANYTVASMPHGAIGDAFLSGSLSWSRAALISWEGGETLYWLNNGKSFYIHVKTAITHTRCRVSRVKVDTTDPPTFPDFEYGDYRDVNITNPIVTGWVQATLLTMTTPQVFWFDLDPIMAYNASIGVVVAIPGDSATQLADLYGCMIDARWVVATLGADTGGLFSRGNPPGYIPIGDPTNGTGWVIDETYGWRAHIRPSFAQYVDPGIQNSTSTVLQKLFLACGLWNPGGAGSGMETHLETILGTTMTNGMGRANPYVSPITTFADQNGPWWRSFLPQGSQQFGPGGNAYNVSDEDQQTYFNTPLEAWIIGYAYAHNDTTIMVSMTCLYVYAAVATLFMLWSIVSGVTSTSWNSVLELLALTLKSPPPGKDELSGVSGGVLSTEPLKQRYCLLAKEDEVQLVAIHGELPVKNRVQPNKVYN